MKLRIPQKLRLKLSRKYLDWAEALPRFGGGPIASLQEHRDFQRRLAKKTYEITRPPEGTRIQLMYFRLFELFLLDEYRELQEAIVRFMPELTGISHRRDYEALANFSRGEGPAFFNIGVITREHTFSFASAGRVRRVDPELPQEVKFIELGLRRVLPSLFFITFDVHLVEEATLKVNRLQEILYLPQVTFHSLLPRSGLMAASFTNAKSTMIREIHDWTQTLRDRIEMQLHPVINGGLFSGDQSDHRAKLPAMEVYAIRGVPKDDAKFKQWQEQARGWYQSFGFNVYDFRYKDEKCIFEFPIFYGSNMDDDIGVKARLLALWEPYLAHISEEDSDYSDMGLSQLKFRTRYIVNDAFDFISLMTFLDSVLANLLKLKKLAFRKKANLSLPKIIRLNERLVYEKMIVDTMLQEFQEWQDGLGKQFSGELDNLTFTGNVDELRSLRGDLIKGIEFRLDRLDRNLSNVEASFSNHLTLQNIEAIYKLQRTAAWATSIAVVIAILSVLPSSWFDSLGELIRRILGLL